MRKLTIGALLGTVLFCASAHGQEHREVWEEYGKRVGRASSITAHGPDLMGDNVSLSNGALSFSVTDVEIPGNDSLPVAFTRTLSVVDRTGKDRDAPLGDWEIDLPNISGVGRSRFDHTIELKDFQRISPARRFHEEIAYAQAWC